MYIQVGFVLWLLEKTFSPRLINVILFCLNIRGYHNLCSNWHVFSFCVSKLLKPHKLFSISWYWFRENDKRINIQNNQFMINLQIEIYNVPSFLGEFYDNLLPVYFANSEFLVKLDMYNYGLWTQVKGRNTWFTEGVEQDFHAGSICGLCQNREKDK